MSPQGFKLPTSAGKAVKKLSKFLETKQQDPPLLTTILPVDIIEEILLHLPSRDILRMKQVRRDCADVNI